MCAHRRVLLCFSYSTASEGVSRLEQHFQQSPFYLSAQLALAICIQNKYNGHTLNVGSSCVLYFENYLTNKASDEAFTTYRKRIEKENAIISRKTEFAAEYPELNKILFNYAQTRDNSKILLSKSLFEKLNSFINQIELFRSNYCIAPPNKPCQVQAA